tara:strand:- start:352 stop:1074 length:723 start_codon:yes stop_codon:yes gene_type:complete
MSKLDIIIPVYNEDENIVVLLKEIEKNIDCNFKILICYDNDSDKTLKHLKLNEIFKDKLILIKNPKQGPNSAIIEGINKSNAEIILIYMADDFENIKLINEMVKLIDSGNDLVIPSRFISGGKMLGAKKIKKFVTIIGSILLYRLAQIPYRDCTNAFKMFSSRLKNKITFKSTKGFTFATELTVKSFFLRSKIIEIPSVWKETRERKSNFKMVRWLPYYIYWLFYSIFNHVIFKIQSFKK